MEDIDPVTNVAISRLRKPFIADDSEESLQKFLSSKRKFMFKFQPGPSDNGFVYVTSNDRKISKNGRTMSIPTFPSDFRLEPINVPGSLSNVNKNYLSYLNDLFEIYYSLDNYKYPISLSEIGLKNSNREAKRNQETILYSAIDSSINSLELLLNKEVDADSERQQQKASKQQQKSSVDTTMEEDDIEENTEDEEAFSEQAFDLKDFLNVLMFIKTFYFSNELNLPHNCSIWINKSDLSNPPRELLEEILSLENPYEYDLFYLYVNQLLIRGLFEQASNILINTDINGSDEGNDTTTNSFLAGSSTNGTKNKKSEFINYIHDCLVKCINDYFELHNSSAGYAEEQATDSSDDDLSSMIYRVEYLRQDYKRSVLQIINTINDYISTNSATIANEEKVMLLQFRTSLQLLSGSKSAILNQASTWYEALCGFILFDLPNFKLINEYLNSINTKFEINYMNIWEVLCFDLLKNNNFLKALKSLESLDSDSVAYLAVLLEAKGYLNDYNRTDFLNGEDLDNLSMNDNKQLEENIILDNDGNSLTISQYLLYTHAFKCFSNKELVPNAIGILKSLNLKNFKAILTSYLPYNFYCDNNDDSEWLLSICAENQLIELSSNIYKLIGLNYYDNGLILESLTTLMKCADYPTILKIIWELFNKKLISKYKDDFSEILMIDLVINRGEDYDIDDNILTEFQKMQILQCQIDPLLKRLLAPYQQLLKFLNYDTDMDFRSSKLFLIKLINFKYLPGENLVILLLFLLKYFNLSIVDTENADSQDLKIGISLFEISELINIIEILNELESTKNSKNFEDLNSSYLQYLSEVNYKISIEYKDYGIEVPKDLALLIKQLREKISFEISRKFLE